QTTEQGNHQHNAGDKKLRQRRRGQAAHGGIFTAADGLKLLQLLVELMAAFIQCVDRCTHFINAVLQSAPLRLHTGQQFMPAGAGSRWVSSTASVMVVRIFATAGSPWLGRAAIICTTSLQAGGSGACSAASRQRVSTLSMALLICRCRPG